MSKKNNVNIKIAADVQDAKKGIDGVSQKLNQLTNSIQKSKIEKFAQSFTLAGRTLNTAQKAFSAVKQAISAMSDAYETQIKAELQLETAAKNNPYLDDYSVSKLKAFASEMQAVSAVGDETLIPLMSQLAAAGRTQAEIQSIMSVALDVSASGMMSLDSAVSALNKTFSGSAGTLGNQIAELKNLTKEELASGEAVRIVGERFKGMSKSVADSTGGWVKFKNSMGDFMEVLGKPISALKNITGGVLSKVIDGFSAAVSFFETGKTKARELREELEKLNNNKETASAQSLQDEIDLLEKDLEERKKRVEIISSSNQKEINEELQKQIAIRKTADEAVKSLDKQVKAAQKAKNAYSVNKNSDEYKNAVANLEELSPQLEEARSKYNSAQKEIKALNAAITKAMADTMVEEAQKGAETVDAEISAMENRLADLKKQLAAMPKTTTQPAGSSEADNTALDAQKEYAETIKKLEKNIHLRRQTGEVITEEAEKQMMLNAKVAAYITAREKAGNAMTDKNPWVKQVLSDIELLSEEVDTSKAVFDFIGDGFKDAKEKIISELNSLDAEYKRLMTTVDFSAIEDGEEKKYQIYEAWAQKRAEYENQLKELEKQNTGELVEDWEQKMNDVCQKIVDITSSIASTMQSISDLVQQNAQNEAKIKQAQLEKIYKAGIISEAAYYLQKEKIEKEAAKKQYKMQLAEWTSSIAQATVNTAVGATKSLTSAPFPINAVLAAATMAAGSIQLATIIANKPTPAYASGGIVGGSSYSGDRVTANVNSGEMILNASQQRALWETANGAGGKNGGVNLSVKNYAGASVTPQITSDGIELIIKKTVNAGLESGEFTSSLIAAQASQNGTRYSS